MQLEGLDIQLSYIFLQSDTVEVFLKHKQLAILPRIVR